MYIETKFDAEVPDAEWTSIGLFRNTAGMGFGGGGRDRTVDLGVMNPTL